MVKSVLDKNINYSENKKLDPEDSDYDASLYEISLLKENVIIALGQAKYTFIEEKIIYYPIYLVKDNKVSIQIGVYEIISDNLPNIIDDDGDIILEKIDQPLLYSFVKYEMMKDASIDRPLNTEKKSPKNDNEDSEDSEDSGDSDGEDEDEGSEDDGSEDDGSEDEGSGDDGGESGDEDDDGENDGSGDEEDDFKISIPEQNDKQYSIEKKEYNEIDDAPWIQKYLKSNHFLTVDSMIEKGDDPGDCLFSVISDALRSSQKNISVKELRTKLSKEVTEEIYENYKSKYTMFNNSVKENNESMKKFNKENNELRERLQNTKNRDEQVKIIEQAKQLATEFQILKNENTLSKEMLNEFYFMKNVNNIEDFKNIIKTCNFWADTWAISTLERILKIKIILFSKESFDETDYNNVLTCGQLNDSILEKQGEFIPDFYILTEYNGSHYRLITYMHHKLLSFNEIPYSVKLLISSKCMEKNAGPYYIIPSFKIFNESLGISEEDISQSISEDISNSGSNSLYTNDVILQFYIKSNNKPLPGKGNGEKISNQDIKKYATLATFSEWRRKLSNEFESEFTLDGHKWFSVEHYYQACKFKNTNKEFFLQFSLDSDSNLSKNVELAKAAGSKSGRYKKDLLRHKDIHIDPEFYNSMDEKCLEEAIYAKFSQNKELKDVLINTNNAKLLIYKKGTEPEIANKLMIIRNKIQRETK